jgi:hypothetical protein
VRIRPRSGQARLALAARMLAVVLFAISRTSSPSHLGDLALRACARARARQLPAEGIPRAWRGVHLIGGLAHRPWDAASWPTVDHFDGADLGAEPILRATRSAARHDRRLGMSRGLATAWHGLTRRDADGGACRRFHGSTLDASEPPPRAGPHHVQAEPDPGPLGTPLVLRHSHLAQPTRSASESYCERKRHDDHGGCDGDSCRDYRVRSSAPR